jgi:hypothetical protein
MSSTASALQQNLIQLWRYNAPGTGELMKVRETVIGIMLLICIITLCVIATSNTNKIQIDPVAQQINAIKNAFPISDTTSMNRRAELIEQILKDK